MAVGDDATAAGYPIVAQTALVNAGATEINRTRDLIAELKTSIPLPLPINKGGTGATDITHVKFALGINSGTAAPNDSNGGTTDGNVYFQIVG